MHTGLRHGLPSAASVRTWRLSSNPPSFVVAQLVGAGRFGARAGSLTTDRTANSRAPRILPRPWRFELRLRPENLWVPGRARRLVHPVLPYENRDTQVPEQLRFCHSKFESATSTAAGGAELSTATGGRHSQRTPGRRGGQLVSAAQNDREPPTNSPEEPNFLSSKENAGKQTLEQLHERRKQVVRLHKKGIKTMPRAPRVAASGPAGMIPRHALYWARRWT